MVDLSVFPVFSGGIREARGVVRGVPGLHLQGGFAVSLLIVCSNKGLK